jgi:hypothetical protein
MAETLSKLMSTSSTMSMFVNHESSLIVVSTQVMCSCHSYNQLSAVLVSIIKRYSFNPELQKLE